jgi:hypothetical protein
MQAISVYLYPNKLDVFTNLPSAWSTERYRKVYNRNIKIFRGVDNRVDLQVRNPDEKKQDITGSTLVFHLVSRETQELLIQKDCTISSVVNGQAYVILTEEEVNLLEPGFYQYAVTKELRTPIDSTTHTVTSRTPLYIDSQYGTIAIIEIGNGIKGQPVDSVRVAAFSKHQSFGETFSTYFVSSIIDAAPVTTTPQSLHTFQLNMTSYIGDMIIQGSISDGGNPQVWVDVDSFTVNNDDILYKNVTGKYNWFRVKHIPGLSNTGTVDSILYR